MTESRLMTGSLTSHFYCVSLVQNKTSQFPVCGRNCPKRESERKFCSVQVKLWDLTNNQPTCIGSVNPKVVRPLSGCWSLAVWNEWLLIQMHIIYKQFSDFHLDGDEVQISHFVN